MMRVAILVALLLCPLLPAQEGKRAEPPVRGVTISTHGSGRDWGSSERIGKAFDAVKALGANWVAIHPYAGIRKDGRVRWRRQDQAPPVHWTRPIEEAHRRGLRIMIKPHLAHWGSGFSWRGDIRFDDKESRQRFFHEYGRWIEEVARACKKADAFVVGTELDGTTSSEKEWRRVIERVRAVTPAPLSFASNWTDFERVRFWDALDAIGVQAYFPVGKRDAGKAEIRASWVRHMAKLRAFSKARARRICFTELGYCQAFEAPAKPWAYHRDGDAAAAVQLRCLGLALEAVEKEPAVVGAFLWKWFPPPRTNGRDFRLDTPGVRQLLKRLWSTKPR